MNIKPLHLKIIKLLLKIGVALVLVYFISGKININEVGLLLSKVKPVYMVLAFIAFTLSAWAAPVRFRFLLLRIIPSPKVYYNHRLYLMGMFYNVFLPGGTGGNSYKIFTLHRRFGTSSKQLFQAFLRDRLIGLWAMIFIMALVFGCMPGYLNSPLLFSILALILCCALCFLLLRILFRSFSEVIKVVRALAFCVQAMQAVIVVLLLRLQMLHSAYFPYIFSFSAALLATLIPTSIGGIGIREYVMLHASPLFGMQAALAVFICSAFWLLSTCFSLFGGVFLFNKTRNPVSISSGNESGYKFFLQREA